ncbi:MAG: hypothetical protein HYS09_02470 [Chloroflexi bacterium]|nr:hypothetical protein [Chloroflexota bacterium]
MRKGIAAEISQPKVSECRHHWIIDSPRGTVSRGRCKLCRAEREFRNSTPDGYWDSDRSSDYSSWGSARSVPTTSDDEEMSMAGGSRRGGLALAL